MHTNIDESHRFHVEQRSPETEGIYCVCSFVRNSRIGKVNL